MGFRKRWSTGGDHRPGTLSVTLVLGNYRDTCSVEAPVAATTTGARISGAYSCDLDSGRFRLKRVR